MEEQNKSYKAMFQEAFNVGYYLEKKAPTLLKRLESLQHHPWYKEGLVAGKEEAQKEKKMEKRAELLARSKQKSGRDELER